MTTLPLPEFIYKWHVMEKHGHDLSERELDFYFIFDNRLDKELGHELDMDAIQMGKGTFPTWSKDPLMITLYAPEEISIDPKLVEYSRN